MIRGGHLVFLVWLLLLAPVTVGVTRAGQAATANRFRSVWDGVYTAAQAARGEKQFDTVCSSCHGSDLQGDGADAPPLAGMRFTKKWDGRNLRALFTVATETMPQDSPGTLDKDVYSDLLAYILQTNGFPEGSTELGHDPDDLGRIAFEQTPPSPP